MSRIGIVGSRRRDSENDFKIAESVFLSVYKAGDLIVSGGCKKGGDRFAEIISKKYDVRIIIFNALWAEFGRGAGFIRNTDIAKFSDILIAVVASDRKGGTEDTIKKFEKIHNKKALIIL